MTNNDRINDLLANIKATKGVIIELGTHEWNADQVRFQERRIAAMEREIAALSEGV